jgi:hypothetical protein
MYFLTGRWVVLYLSCCLCTLSFSLKGQVTISYSSLTGNYSCPPTLRVKIVSGGGFVIPTTGAGVPRLYFIKNIATQPNIFVNNTNTTVGWKYVLGVPVPGFPDSFDFTFDYGLLNNAPVVAGDEISYFIVAENNNILPDVAAKSGAVVPTFSAAFSSVQLTAAHFPVGGGVLDKFKAGYLFGNVSVPGTFPSLTGPGGLFDAINNGGLEGDLVVSIVSDLTETGTIPLYAWREKNCPAGGPFRLTIKPSGLARKISGSYPGGLIRLVGADRVTIDGRLSGFLSGLTIENTQLPADGTAGIQLITPTGDPEGCTDVIIQGCTFYSTGADGSVGLAAGGALVGQPDAAHHRLTIRENYFYRADTAVYVGGTFGSRTNDLRIENNRFGNQTPNPNTNLGTRGIVVNYANMPIVSQNILYNLNHTQPMPTVGIELYGTTNATVSRNQLIFFNVNADLTGIALIGDGSGTVSGGTVEKNELRNFSLTGVGNITGLQATSQPAVSFFENIVSGLTISGGGTATGLDAANLLGMSAVGNQFLNITATLGAAVGIRLSAGTASVNLWKNIIGTIIASISGGAAPGFGIQVGAGVAGVNIYNQMIYSIQGRNAAILPTAGIRLETGTNDIDIIHNSVSLSGATAAASQAALSIDAGSSNLTVVNNIFRNEAVGGVRYAVYSQTPATGFTVIDYNDYYIGAPAPGSSVIGFITGTDYLTLANWQAATGQDAHSISTNPFFFSESDLHTRNPLLDQKASIGYLSQVSDDIDNEVRSVGGPDIGADEFTPFAIDIAADGFVNPASTIINCNTTSILLRLRVRNNGNTLILSPANPLVIGGRVFGPNSTTILFNESFTSGTIPVGDTLSFTLSVPLSVSASGTYTLSNFSVNVAGDQVSTNNLFTSLNLVKTAPGISISLPIVGISKCVADSFTLSAAVTPSSAGVWYAAAGTAVIPDNNIATLTTNVSLPVAGRAAYVKTVQVNIAHLEVGDLKLELIAPDGSTIILSNGHGGSGDDYANTRFTTAAPINISAGSAPFIGDYQPEEPFSGLTGPALGVWTLQVSDQILNAVGGTILGFSVEFNIIETQWSVIPPISFADSVVTPGKIATPAVSQATNFTFTLTVRDATGCISSSMRNLEVLPYDVSAPVVKSQIICRGDTVSLLASGAPAGSKYVWYRNNRPSSPNAPADTAIAVGNALLFTSLEEDTILWVAAVYGNCTSSTRASAYIDVIPPPPDPIAPQLEPICKGNSVVITPINNSPEKNITYHWYRDSTAGAPFLTAPSYATPVLYDTLKVWVSTILYNCTNRVRVPIVLAVRPEVPAPVLITEPGVYCTGTAVRVLASNALPGAQQLWYSSATAPVPFFAGNSYQTSPLAGDTVLWVGSVFEGCTSATRSSVPVKMFVTPPPPLVRGASICPGQQATLTAEGRGRMFWFDSAVGGTPIATGLSYTTPILEDSITYYVQASDSGCVSDRVPVKVALSSLIPPLPLVISDNVTCAGGRATLRAVTETGSIRWFRRPAGSFPPVTADSFVTPILNQADTFLVQVDNGACRSQLKVVPVQVVSSPSEPQILVPDAVNDSVNLYDAFKVVGSVKPDAGLARYSWRFGPELKGAPWNARGDTFLLSAQRFGPVIIEMTATIGTCVVSTTKKIIVRKIAAAALEDRLSDFTAQIYPNPTRDTLAVVLQFKERPGSAVRWRILSISGQEVLAGQWPADSTAGVWQADQVHEKLSLKGLAAGMYFLVVETAGRVMSSKISVE